MPAAQLSNYDLSTAIASALQRSVGHYKKPSAVISERVGRSIGAAKKWLAGENAPGLAEAIELMREFKEVRDVILRLADCEPADLTETEREAAVAALRILTERR